MAAKQRIIQRVREGERNKIRDEYATKVGDLLCGEVQQVERGKIVMMLNKSRGCRSDHSVEGAEPARAVPPGRADSCGTEARRGDARRAPA